MEQIKKNFGFGCMRLPMNGENVDTAETCRMVDAFLDAGFNYFDTGPRLSAGQERAGPARVPDEPLPARALYPDGQADRRLLQDRGAHLLPRPLRHHEHEADPPRLERGLLL